MRAGRLLASAVVSGFLLVAQPAVAYRTAADVPRFHTQLPVSWAGPIEYHINEQLPSGIAPADVAQLVARAAATWAAPACSGAQFSSKGFAAQPAAPGDGVNTVQWLFSGWSEHGFPADSPGATDVLYEKDAAGDWHLLEADVYLNGSGRDWVLESPVPDGKWDLLSVLTHELGHAAGLAHPCEIEGTSGAPICDESPARAEVTMYPLYNPGQSTLADDDVNGICFLYPASTCDSSCPNDMFCSPDGCVPRCGASVCSRGETCEDSGCVLITPPLPCSMDSDPLCTECKRDADCKAGAVCAAGKCLNGSALGDPCTQRSDCVEGLCSDDGACMSLCARDADCNRGAACEKQRDGGKVCAGSAQPAPLASRRMTVLEASVWPASALRRFVLGSAEVIHRRRPNAPRAGAARS